MHKTRRLKLADDVLLWDVGNTKLAACLLRSGQERARMHLVHAQLATRHWTKLCNDMVLALRARCSRRLPVVLASVAPARLRIIEKLLRAAGFAHLHVAGWRDPWPFEIDVETPASIGVDRLANVAGLRGLGARSGLVVDAGTAITFDVLKEGVFVGGLILPGFDLAARALHEHTEQLPLVEASAVETVIGRHTRAALQAGIHQGTVGAVQALVRRFRGRLGRGARFVVTGGAGEPFSAACGSGVPYEPDLVFQGLRVLTHRVL